jgi:hypothetical protein
MKTSKDFNFDNCTPLYRCPDGHLRTPAEMKAAGIKSSGAVGMDAAPAPSPKRISDSEARQILEAVVRGYKPRRRREATPAFDNAPRQMSNQDLNDHYRQLKEQGGSVYSYSIE